MLSYPHIDPVMLDLPGPFDLRWYGLMYVLGFAAAYALGRYRARQPQSDWTPRQVEDMVVWGAFGVILGGRLGSALFYQPGHYLSQPLDLLRIWEGGMSFHGGLIGVLVACWLLGRRQGRGFFAVTDFIAPLVPLGVGFGRIGNFINGELWGRPTELPWGMVFPGAGSLPRHPSQLYESLLEGFVLFALLWWFSARPRPRMAVSGLFLFGYGLFRSLVEFAREPDAHLGFVAFDWLTMGQLLSLPMMLAGAGMLALAYRGEAAAKQRRSAATRSNH